MQLVDRETIQTFGTVVEIFQLLSPLLLLALLLLVDEALPMTSPVYVITTTKHGGMQRQVSHSASPALAVSCSQPVLTSAGKI